MAGEAPSCCAMMAAYSESWAWNEDLEKFTEFNSTRLPDPLASSAIKFYSAKAEAQSKIEKVVKCPMKPTPTSQR
jgi:hypothetical protein